MAQPLLQVENLRTYFGTPRGTVKAVDGVNFSIQEGETLAVVGESGCGKSMTALSIMQLVPEPAGYIESGRILFEGKDLLDLTWDQMRDVRGKGIGMIFQEPMTSLNPVYTIGQQLLETGQVHGQSTEQARSRALELLARVRMDDPALTMRRYPHELSGGMRQRVMIAMSLMNRPKLLIADEPTTALDVTVQAQILGLLAELQRELKMAMLLITHDLGLVAEMADDVVVMYAGEVIEHAPIDKLFDKPQAPYTRGLFASLPTRGQRGKDLAVLEGAVPDPLNWPKGCRFEARCPERFEDCKPIHPELRTVGLEQSARCLLHPECYPAGSQKSGAGARKKAGVA